MKAELVLDLVVSDIISEMFLFLILQPEFRNRLDKRKQDRIAAIVILQFFPTILNFASTHSSKLNENSQKNDTIDCFHSILMTNK